TLSVILHPGAEKDTVFIFNGVGHELSGGVFQDIHLIFVEKPHPSRFQRHKGDLTIRVSLPWTDRLCKAPCRFSVTGVDEKKYSLEVDYLNSKMITGRAIFKGAGMPLLDGKRRGKMTIE